MAKKRRRAPAQNGVGVKATKALGKGAVALGTGVGIGFAKKKLGDKVAKGIKWTALLAGVAGELLLPDGAAKTALSAMGTGACGALGVELGERGADILDAKTKEVVQQAKQEVTDEVSNRIAMLELDDEKPVKRQAKKEDA